ncbi:MAG TPA: hypothetical protein VLJ58_03830 [Ramlibacter sp.]|nr:hypothetical protein [Ramlibacter sp.]
MHSRPRQGPRPHRQRAWRPAHLLDNKAALAQYYAVEQGLGRHTQAEDIAFGRELAALVTAEGITAAIALVGIENDAAA